MARARKAVVIGLDGASAELFAAYLESGALPNISRLAQRGSRAAAWWSICGNTPVNWTGIATGAHPGTHGIIDFALHPPGSVPDTRENAFRSTHVRAESIWNTAEKAGRRSAVLNYPCAYPSTMREGIFVGGEGSPGAGSIFEVRSSGCFASEDSALEAENCEVVRFAPDSDGKPSTAIRLVPGGGAGKAGPEYSVLLLDSAGSGCDRALIEGGAAPFVLRVGEWSEWLCDDFTGDGLKRTGWFRFKLSELSADARRFRLYTSQVFPEEGYTDPEGVGRELTREVGPFLEHTGSSPYRNRWITASDWMDELEYQGMWFAKAGCHLLSRQQCDLVMFHFHIFDHVSHSLWGGFDPICPWYQASTAEEYEGLFLRAHHIADEMVRVFVDHVDEDTLLIVVSDHGEVPHIKSVSVNNLLARAGLISCRSGAGGPGGKPIIDWGNTKAYAPTATSHIWINLRGREPEGIVDPQDYERMQKQIIDLLLGYRDPDTGERVVAWALKKRDAAPYGLWGDRVGDVIFLMNPIYSADNSWFPLTNDGRVMFQAGPEAEEEGLYPASHMQSSHGYPPPTTILGRGSEAGVFIASGPGVREGMTRDNPVALVDVAPTIAFLLGIPQPAQAEGRVLFDLLSP